MRERRSIATRAASALLALPEDWLLRLSGAGMPVVRDGRVLDPRVQALLALGDRTGATDRAGTPEERRADLRRLAAVGMPVRTNVLVNERVLPGPASELRVRIYRRPDGLAATPAIVYFHGGGWVTGDLDTHDGSCRLIADITGCTVIAVDYRLAPEAPFPAAPLDGIAAYRWVHEHAFELSVLPGRVGVMGDSAGGTLAAVVSQLAHDDPEVPDPVAQCLIYPSTDSNFRTPSIETFAEGFSLTRESMNWFRQQYLPDPATLDDPRASPLLRSDLSGLAPAIIVTAGFDPLRDDGRLYAEALSAAGVEVRYRCYDDQIHGFFGMGVLPDGMAMASEICAEMGDWMRREPAR